MKIDKKWFISLLLGSFLLFGSYSQGFSWEKWTKDDPITDEWIIMDILVARPLGIVAGIVGGGLFVLSLPFSIPTQNIGKMSEVLIERPFKFSFRRELPDEGM